MLNLGNRTMTQRALGWFSRPARWFKKPLGKLAKPLGKLAKPLGNIDGIERPALYLGIAFVLWRLWRENSQSGLRARGDSSGRPGRRRRPSLRMLVQNRLDRAAFDRADDQQPRAGA